jgi:hypothetical protein
MEAVDRPPYIQRGFIDKEEEARGGREVSRWSSIEKQR